MAELDEVHLRSVLENPDSVVYFKDFLDKTFSTENLYFWMEIEVYRKLTDQEIIQQTANEIFSKYFDPESIYELNVPSSVRDQLTAEMKKQQANSNLFEDAQKSVFQTMEMDLWGRFKNCDMYAKCIKELKNTTPSTSKTEGREDRERVYRRMYTQFHLSLQRTVKQGGNKRTLFSTQSTVHLQTLILKNNPTPPTTPTPPKQNTNPSPLLSNNNGQMGLIQMGILSNMLMPLHATIGSLTKAPDTTPPPIRKLTAPLSTSTQPINVNLYFELPETEEVITYFQCSYCGKKKLFFKGRLYLTQKHLAFKSDEESDDLKKLIHLSNVVSFEKANTSGVIPNAIEIKTIQGKKFFFSGFVKRDSVIATMEAEQRKVLKSEKDSKVNSTQRKILD